MTPTKVRLDLRHRTVHFELSEALAKAVGKKGLRLSSVGTHHTVFFKKPQGAVAEVGMGKYEIRIGFDKKVVGHCEVGPTTDHILLDA